MNDHDEDDTFFMFDDNFIDADIVVTSTNIKQDQNDLNELSKRSKRREKKKEIYRNCKKELKSIEEKDKSKSSIIIQVPFQETLANKNDPECKHWKRTKGNCMFGDKCKFQHIQFSYDSIIEKEKSNEIIRDPDSGKRKRKRPRNKGRAGEFRRWLIDTFGVDLLRSGSGILDIAGGKGEISFELENLNHCKSTIIDPRNYIDFSRFQKKLLKGFYHRNEMISEKFNDSIQLPNSIDEIITPNHVKLFWTPILWECLSLCSDFNTDDYDKDYLQFKEYLSYDNDDNDNDDIDSFEFNGVEYLKKLFYTARTYTWTDKGLKIPQQLGYNNNDDEELGDNETTISNIEDNNENYKEWSFNELKYLLENCSCVIGMHPDQAAEGIVDFALRMKKPFALLPCCVYSKQFPKKKTSDGKHVTNYYDLIDHLTSKHPDIKTTKLPFEGKNTVVYWIPIE